MKNDHYSSWYLPLIQTWDRQSHEFAEIQKDAIKRKSSGAAAKAFCGFYSFLGVSPQTVLKIRFQDKLKLLLMGYMVIS